MQTLEIPSEYNLADHIVFLFGQLGWAEMKLTDQHVFSGGKFNVAVSSSSMSKLSSLLP
jgi:hypothetical protein